MYKVARIREEHRLAREALSKFFEETRHEVILQAKAEKADIQEALELQYLLDQKKVAEIQDRKIHIKTHQDKKHSDVGFSRAFVAQQNMVSRHIRMSGKPYLLIWSHFLSNYDKNTCRLLRKYHIFPIWYTHET